MLKLAFGTTPIGRIMNRFSKDIETIDQELAPVAIALFSDVLAVITVIMVIAITPLFVFPGVIIVFLFGLTSLLFLHTSVDLKRLESTTPSPIFQQFGETLNGITTIRAYGGEFRFSLANILKLNTHSRPSLYVWGANRWLSLRVDFLGAFLAFFCCNLCYI